MSDRPSHNLGGLDIDLARRIDEICRRFEAGCREGRRPRIEDYLGEVPGEGRPALRAELIALERELSPSDETVARPEAGPPTAPEPLTAPSPSTIAEAPTIAPGPPPNSPIADTACPAIHEQATLPPNNPPQSPHNQPTAAVLGQDPSTTPGASGPTRVRYFGDYEIIRELARGGMGVVFQARQISLNRPVALKMILAGQLANETDVRRFYTEAEAAANLDHPGIVPIFEVGQHEGQHYFSMGFVEGQSLAQRLAQGPLPAREAAELIRRVSEAIEYAHQRGVVHRDLKPGNVLLDVSGNPRITDFGLAKKVQGDSGLTGSGQIMGTPSYMPPEQAGGKRGEVGPAADVYALGATLYALVTGRPPFQAATAMDTVIQVISDEPVPPRRLNASVPRDLETISLKCLEKEPGKRYASAAALAEDLRRYLVGEPIAARPVGPAERAWRWCRRNPAVAGALGMVAAALVVVAVLALLYADQQTRLAQAKTLYANEQKDHARVQAEAAASLKDALTQSNRRLAMFHFERGQSLFEKEQIGTGLLCLVKSWQSAVAAGDPGWQHTARANITAWQSRLFAVKAVFSHQDVVRAVAFSPDCKAVLTGSVDQTARLWPLAEFPDDLPRIAAWAEVVTGLALDEQGSVHALDNAAWCQDRERLEREGGALEMGGRWRLDPILFGPEPTARARAWIERQRWTQAEAAFDEVILARPLDGDVVLERARFHAARSRPDKADEGFLQAWALGSRDAGLIEAILRSEALFARAVTEQPDSVSLLWSTRGEDRARRQRWADAAADYGKAVRLEPENLPIRRSHILSLMAAGERDPLRRARADLLDRFGRTGVPDVANNAARYCLLASGANDHRELLVRLTEFAVNVAPDASSKREYLSTFGAALYRAGRFEDAILQLEEGIQLKGGTGGPEDWVFLAMAHHRLGHRDLARRYLESLRIRPQSTNPSQFWDELEIRLLRGEAEATILDDPIFPADPFKH